ncbi:MAG: indolepyruvate ferredoxin oxidoreductase subunit alpha [Deltaproteobacteria bacterium]|nr:indolepyruvate ferredoxin oxidoreductase subunit alpha [Deltaproteobacteria bacterium]
MSIVALDEPGRTELLMGNEAIARGAVEAGVSFCAGYPGNPSSEIMETLAETAKQAGHYAEWSVNEKVALEAAAAASFAGVRAISSMKQNGVNVVSDFLTNLSLSGTKGGLVLVTCDDPSGISSTNEEDARFIGRVGFVPVLEPSTPQDALEITKFAFDLSEELKSLVVVRSLTRVSHTRGLVRFGEIKKNKPTPRFDTTTSFHTFPVSLKHQIMREKLARAAEIFEHSPFNQYSGPDLPEVLIIVCGVSALYGKEAISLMGLQDRVGLLKIGTTWPLPPKLITAHLRTTDKILFLEEVDPYLETSVKAMAAQLGPDLGLKHFYGKESGHIPAVGELSSDLVAEALHRIMGVDLPAVDRDYLDRAKKAADELVPIRELGFCPGCPHRASYWSIKNALKMDGRDGFVSGDIGCYTLGVFPTGFNQVKSVHCMGSGLGIACGYGKLGPQGFDQPVITVCGDSTFFHAGIPALINARYNQSNFVLLILDNSATAMTGFQPHPGTGMAAMGNPAGRVDPEVLCRALDLPVTVCDPYDLPGTTKILYEAVKRGREAQVIIMKRKCALVQNREGGFPYRLEVDQDKCRGLNCGCSRYCTRIFRCPGLIWDSSTKTARIDEAICVGCGVCADVCSHSAIIRRPKNTGQAA